LIAISPMLTRYAPQMVKKLGLQFPVLSDPDSRVMEQLGVLFTLPDEMIEIYKGFGIDLERFNGESSWRLPLPGRIIIGKDGVVRHIELTTDHHDRPEPAEALALLKNL
jgi:peroxiredoxin